MNDHPPVPSAGNWGDLSRRSRAGATLAIAVALSLLAGLARSALAIERWLFTERISQFSRDIVWKAPVGTLLVFAIPALVLALMAATRPRFATLRSVLFAIAVPAALSVVLLVGGLHETAAWILSLGLAWRLAEVLSKDPARTERLAWRASGIALTLTAILGFGLRGGQAMLEHWRVARLPAAAPGLPNILLVVMDATRATELSVYGYDRPTTPALEAMAREAVVFDWAISPSSWSLPSHGSLFTGRYSGDLRATARSRIQGNWPTLAAALRSRGYVTGGFAANPYYTTRESGLARGFLHYDASHRNLREILFGATLMQSQAVWAWRSARDASEALAALVPPHLTLVSNVSHDIAPAGLEVTRFLTWQSGIRGRPFFAFINLFDAHNPYRPPAPWAVRFGPDDIPRNRYDGAIAYEDAQLDRLFRALRARQVLDRTIVVVTADHGEHFGEHGLKEHGNGLYLPVLHVPLLIRYPGRLPASHRVDAPVGTRRIAATLLDLAGITDTSIPGPSLAATWSGAGQSEVARAQMEASEDADEFAPATRGAMRSVLDWRWHYIVEGDGSEELYAYRSDPGERVNLVRGGRDDTALVRLRALARAMP